MTLANLPEKSKATIIAVQDQNLIDRGFARSASVEVLRKYPLLVRVDSCLWGLDSELASAILVCPAATSGSHG